MKQNVYSQYRAHFRFQMVWRAESVNIVYKQDTFVTPWYELRPGATCNPLSMFMKLGINDLYIMQNKTYIVNIGLTSGFRWYGELNRLISSINKLYLLSPGINFDLGRPVILFQCL